jgi:hypothetical protein
MPTGFFLCPLSRDGKHQGSSRENGSEPLTDSPQNKIGCNHADTKRQKSLWPIQRTVS